MARYHKGYNRSERISEQVKRELANLIQQLKDPRTDWVTITMVDVTRDNAHAKVFYTVLDEAGKTITQEVLEHSAGFLRSELGKRIQIYSTPQLHFFYDESVEHGMHIDRLLDQIKQDNAKRGGPID